MDLCEFEKCTKSLVQNNVFVAALRDEICLVQPHDSHIVIYVSVQKRNYFEFCQVLEKLLQNVVSGDIEYYSKKFALRLLYTKKNVFLQVWNFDSSYFFFAT